MTLFEMLFVTVMMMLNSVRKSLEKLAFYNIDKLNFRAKSQHYNYVHCNHFWRENSNICKISVNKKILLLSLFDKEIIQTRDIFVMFKTLCALFYCDFRIKLTFVLRCTYFGMKIVSLFW